MGVMDVFYVVRFLPVCTAASDFGEVTDCTHGPKEACLWSEKVTAENLIMHGTHVSEVYGPPLRAVEQKPLPG